MAGIDFPSSPSVGQLFPASNTVTYKWDGTVWIVNAVGPASLPPSGAAGGDLTGSYPNPTLATVGAEVTINGTLPTIPNGAYTTVTWDAAPVNRSSIWSVGNAQRITLPSLGVWFFYTLIMWDDNATGLRVLIVSNKAGTQLSRVDAVGSNGSSTSQYLHRFYSVTDVTDYLYVQVYQASGVGLALKGVTRPTFGAWKLAT